MRVPPGADAPLGARQVETGDVDARPVGEVGVDLTVEVLEQHRRVAGVGRVAQQPLERCKVPFGRNLADVLAPHGSDLRPWIGGAGRQKSDGTSTNRHEGKSPPEAEPQELPPAVSRPLWGLCRLVLHLGLGLGADCHRSRSAGKRHGCWHSQRGGRLRVLGLSDSQIHHERPWVFHLTALQILERGLQIATHGNTPFR